MNNQKVEKLQQQMLSQISDAALFDQAKEHAQEYLQNVLDRRVFPGEEALRNLDAFNEPMPDLPCPPDELLNLLHEKGSPATVAQLGGRYFGFVNGSSIPASLAAKWLSDVWDQNAVLYVTSPIASTLESVCERWLIELLGMPAQTAAGLVSGSSIAALCGLASARNELLKRQGWDVSADGLFGAPQIRVILSEQAHATIFKALSLLGLGRNRVEMVPADDQGRMIAEKIPTLDDRCLVIAQAGNVNSGAFDPLDEICELAQNAGAWVHVDGAFGLWAAASRKKQALLKGFEKADSWSMDAHKTLNAPYDCGIVLCKHRDALVSAMQMSGSYIVISEKGDNLLYTPEMSRRARAVELWATLKSLGKLGVEDLVDRLCEHAQLFAHLLQKEGFAILNEVVFNQVLVQCSSADLTKAVLDNVQKSGECWCGGTVWNGKTAIRISVCSWATTSADVERSVRAFVNARDLAQNNERNNG